MGNFRPPLSNLGPMSEPWGRFITEQTVTNAEAIERLGGDARNDGRINNSAIDNLASQIKELSARQATISTGANLTTPTFNQTGTTVSATRTIQLPRPSDGARMGWLAVSGDPSLSASLDSTVFVTFSIDGREFYRSSIGLPAASALPSGWDNFTFQGATGFQASPSSGGTLTILLQARGLSFATGNRTASLTGITATAAYAQRA